MYEVKVKSKEEMNQLSTKMTTTFSNSAAFTTEMQKTMKANDVKSVSPSSITADTTAAPKSAGNDESADGDYISNKTDGDDGSSTLIIVIVVLVVVCIVALLGAVVFGYTLLPMFHRYQNQKLDAYISSRRPTTELFEGDGRNSFNPLDITGIELSSLDVGNAVEVHFNPASVEASTPPLPPPPPIEINTELPLNWQQVEGVDGPQSNYYWNTVTNVTQYVRPK